VVNKRAVTFANFGVNWFLRVVLDSLYVRLQGQVDTNGRRDICILEIAIKNQRE
jgi:hypothetical protein